MKTEQQNFAAKPIQDIGNDLADKVKEYYDHLERTGRLALCSRSHELYYAACSHHGHIQSAGKQGEYAKMYVNHYRNIANHLLNLITGQRPTFESRAVNTDYKSVTQCTLANGLLEYYMRDKRLDRDLDRASKFGVLYGEGYVLLEWDVNKGEVYKQEPVTDEQGTPVADEQGNPQVQDVRNGDIYNTSLTPIDIIRDPNKTDYSKLDWVIVRRFKNKFDLAAKYSEWEEEILQMGYSYSVEKHDYIGSREYGHQTIRIR